MGTFKKPKSFMRKVVNLNENYIEPVGSHKVWVLRGHCYCLTRGPSSSHSLRGWALTQLYNETLDEEITLLHQHDVHRHGEILPTQYGRTCRLLSPAYFFPFLLRNKSWYLQLGIVFPGIKDDPSEFSCGTVWSCSYGLVSEMEADKLHRTLRKVTYRELTQLQGCLFVLFFFSISSPKSDVLA